MVTMKFICVIAGARVIKLQSYMMLPFLSGSQSFATACQAGTSEAPQQAEPGNASQPGCAETCCRVPGAGRGQPGRGGILMTCLFPWYKIIY